MATATRIVPLRLPVGPDAPAGAGELAADLVIPAQASDPPALVTCLPGGGMNRRYFDLHVDPEHGLGSFSMAHHLAGRGLWVLLVDHLGLGDSDIPDDPWTLTAPVVAAANAHAVDHARAALAAGDLVGGVAPTGPLRSIGVGHSAGGLLTCYQQARFRTHDAVALLGFAGGGLRDHLSAAELDCAHDPAATRQHIVELARTRFGRPLPRGRTTRSELLNRPDVADAAFDAIGAARASLLAVVGLTSMIPGASSEELAAIDVPLFLGVGSHDITGPPERIAEAFPASTDITLHVVPDTGHNHNIAPNRHVLWDALADWIHHTSG